MLCEGPICDNIFHSFIAFWGYIINLIMKHLAIVQLTMDNYASWEKGIITHYRGLNITLNLYGIILELETY